MSAQGKVGKVEQFRRDGANETVQIDTGGGATVEAEHFAPAGDDSPPLPGDYAATVPGSGKGGLQVTGYADPDNERVAAAGEKRIYSRDSDGNVIGTVWLKGDGSILAENSAGTFRLTSDGKIYHSGPEVLLGTAAGRRVACVGDLVAVTVPQLLSAAPGAPCVPVPPTAVTPTGGYVAAGQIISGAATVKAGP